MATDREVEELKQRVDDLTKKLADSKQTDVLRVKHALYLAGAGIGLTVLLILLLAFHWASDGASDIVAVVGVFTTLVGAVVGYFLGGGVGSQGKASSDQRANEAERQRAAGEQKVSNARAFALVANEKLGKHAGVGAKGLVAGSTVDVAEVKNDLRELANLSANLLQ